MAAQDIILFDGDCAYCNGWVRWIAQRDRDKRFRFLPLASEEGIALRTRHGVPADIDSVVLIDNEGGYWRSEAARRIAMQLHGYRWAGSLLRLVPRFLRDWGYDLIARNRHRFVQADRCELP